jgi:hypothetical protein
MSRPTVLAYSIDQKLRPTVAYLTHNFFPTCDAYDAAMCTTYSLKARIVPRVRALKSKGLMATAFKDPAFKVTYVMCASDARFCAMAEMEREKYDELVKQAKEDPDAGKIGWLTDGRRDENERNDETSARDKKKESVAEAGAALSASKVSLTSEEWTLEAAREMAARALREGEGGTSR